MRPFVVRQAALPPTLPPRLICREAAAAYISVAPGTFDKLVQEGRMPRAKRVSEGRVAWDVRSLDAAIDLLPSDVCRSKPTIPGVMLMPHKLPPHVERNHVKGKTYLSFRIGHGPRIRLPDDPRSEAFQDAYRAALLEQVPPGRQRKLPPAPGTIAALIVSYMKSAAYVGLRP